jgi:putative ABC transport system permease protein
MNLVEIIRFTLNSLGVSRSRTLMMMFAIAIGVASVVILTGLGEGARRYVLNQFSSLGTNLVIVFPGRTETAGVGPGMLLGQTPRELSLEDAHALLRSPSIARIAPLTIGTSQISYGALNREAVVLGSTSTLLEVRHMSLSQGQFLPDSDLHASELVCVLGQKIKRELFEQQPAVGAWVKLGDRRFRVIGVLAAQGESMGLNTDDIVIMPVASAHLLFNTSGLFRILIEAKSRELITRAKLDVETIITRQHHNERDITVITQDAVLATFDRILGALTLAVTGIAAISLSVAGILVMNVMLISVSQRRKEIGLLKALGAPPRQIRNIFFAEAILLSSLGSLAGLVLGEFGILIIGNMYPTLPINAPWWAVLAALGSSISLGITFGVWPAQRAAKLDPVLALAGK